MAGRKIGGRASRRSSERETEQDEQGGDELDNAVSCEHGVFLLACNDYVRLVLLPTKTLHHPHPRVAVRASK